MSQFLCIGDQKMAESKGSLIAKSVSKHAGRAKEKLLQNLGKVDRTADEVFEDDLQNFNKQQNAAARLQKEFNNYIRCVRAVQTASKSLLDAINEMYEPQWTGHDLFYVQSQNVEMLWNDLSHKLGDQVLIPLNTYQAQFPEMRKKIDKRGRKLVDFDNARHNLQALQSNNSLKKKDEMKISKAKEQLDEAKRTYDQLNTELHDELPALNESRVLFLVNNLQTLCSAEQLFHAETSKVYAELEAIVDKLANDSQRNSYTLKKQQQPNSPPKTITNSTNNVSVPSSPMSNANNNYRVSVADGSELPSARVLSSGLLRNTKNKQGQNMQGDHNRMFMIFAQLVTHDVMMNFQTKGPNCCSESGDRVLSTSDGCRPILIPEDDPYYSQFGRRCHFYRKSKQLDCYSLPVGTLLPTSVHSHFLDASFLYGADLDKAEELRSWEGGKLRVQQSADGRQYLPTQSVSECPFARNVCYDSGDIRVNGISDIAVLETIFLRLHNSLAEDLAILNPQWNDEVLYQETRKLVIGILQHITYNEWLPRFLGNDFTRSLGLASLNSGYATGYDPTLNPSTLADFSGAAFRTLHSCTPDFITIIPISGGPSRRIPFSSTGERAGDFIQYGDVFDSNIEDLISSPHRKFTSDFSAEILDHTREIQSSPTAPYGEDLAAMDIQRGRDYGLQGYNEYRKLCGLAPFKSFADIAAAFGNETAQQLSTYYKHPDDIDYYIGSILEVSSSGDYKGPSSLRCVWGEAFRRYKFGDRFFYEFGEQPGSFTHEQLQLIRNFEMSHLICIGADNITSVQMQAFDLSDTDATPCASLFDF